ncbi:hypothetical protein E1262_14090, partial [Jiangella aurantiaca]
PAPVPPTPVVAHLAQQLGIDVDTIRGGGVGGRIRLRDLAPLAATGGRPAVTWSHALAEADVTCLLAPPARAGELLARAALAILRAADGIALRAAGLSVTVPGPAGALTAATVPNATELSVAGLARALATVRTRPDAGPAAGVGGSGGLTVHDATNDGLLAELPIVQPAPALLISIGAPRRKVVPDTSGGGLALSVRQTVYVAAASDPGRLPRDEAVRLLDAAVAALEIVSVGD